MSLKAHNQHISIVCLFCCSELISLSILLSGCFIPVCCRHKSSSTKSSTCLVLSSMQWCHSYFQGLGICSAVHQWWWGSVLGHQRDGTMFIHRVGLFSCGVRWQKWLREWGCEHPPGEACPDPFPWACYSLWRLKPPHTASKCQHVHTKLCFLSHVALCLLCKAKLFCELSQTLICPWQNFGVLQQICRLIVLAECQFSFVSFPQSPAVCSESCVTKALLSLKLGFNLQTLIIYYLMPCFSTFWWQFVIFNVGNLIFEI